MKTNLILAVAAAAIVSLSGCAGGGPTHQQVGVGAGAVLGGVAGNALFGGTAGTVGGAAAGALIGNEVGKRR
jgi:osmotically inducible lipoprotein OsmB